MKQALLEILNSIDKIQTNYACIKIPKILVGIIDKVAEELVVYYLRECLELWQGIKEYYEQHPHSTHGITHIKTTVCMERRLSALNYTGNCPCCEYVHRVFRAKGIYQFYWMVDCVKECPLRAIWSEGCENGDSPYLVLNNGGSKGRIEACDKIINECERILNDGKC